MGYGSARYEGACPVKMGQKRGHTHKRRATYQHKHCLARIPGDRLQRNEETKTGELAPEQSDGSLLARTNLALPFRGGERGTAGKPVELR